MIARIADAREQVAQAIAAEFEGVWQVVVEAKDGEGAERRVLAWTRAVGRRVLESAEGIVARWGKVELKLAPYAERVEKDLVIQIDGAKAHLEEGWKEIKVGGVLRKCPVTRQSVGGERGCLPSSEGLANLGEGGRASSGGRKLIGWSAKADSRRCSCLSVQMEESSRAVCSASRFRLITAAVK